MDDQIEQIEDDLINRLSKCFKYPRCIANIEQTIRFIIEGNI